MNSYYPEVVRSIKEVQAIIDADYPEFEDLEVAKENIIKNAHLSTMCESRIIEWENILGIRPLQGSELSDRRETIMARIRGKGKLNTALINSIVRTFTGSNAKSWVKDSVLYVEITPPKDNKNFIFDNIEQELRNKVPAHLGFSINRNYCKWYDITDACETWDNVNTKFADWDDVKSFTVSDNGEVTAYLLDENGNQLVNEVGSILYY